MVRVIRLLSTLMFLVLAACDESDGKGSGGESFSLRPDAECLSSLAAGTIVPGEIFVAFQGHISAEKVQDLLDFYNVDLNYVAENEDVNGLDAYNVSVTVGKEKDYVCTLRQLSDVAWAELHYQITEPQ